MPQFQEQAESRWSWVVLLATLVTQGLTLGFPTCIGIFFADLQHDFQASNSETSWFPSIMISVLHAGGPICSILVEYFGCRVTVMLGGVLASLGMVASSFSYSLSQLYITAGFITGLGMSFSFQGGITALGHYFSYHRTQANALASAGVSIGTTLWPLLSRYLLEVFGWRGTFLIFGGVFLHCCICGAVMRPVSLKTESIYPPPNKVPAQGCLLTCAQALRRRLAFDVFLQNQGYRFYTLGIVWMLMGFTVPHIFLVPFALSHNVEEDKAAWLISIIGFSNIFLRPMTGVVAGWSIFAGHRVYFFILAILLNGLSNLICVISADFSVLVFYCLVYSISMSGIGALMFQVLMDIVPMDRFSSALGLFTILESIPVLISPPLAGLLLDTTGKYSYLFYMSSFFLISAALFLGLSFFTLKKKEKMMDRAKEIIALENDLSLRSIEDLPVPQPPQAVTYVTYVTSV
ncbi:monocarboxylate transporter 6 [Monodelphis domestica]|uniref:monocarboxylate transporter 6 n=1 Tax=Monodelphis domestica TaxID=13616 RepID=UPI0024E26FFF|nr:monocarboxylate transporter 6 [Monodelphis domestica]XP_007482730.2 monocarboxylate transporter 6 [Monodelphis domestica]XP_056673150.1 monocarboxylate transporter 6 [Monodelphis domestica]XP_056673151.1 monocarboxylate transporter 6 [Monodelphis domestica]XP_056673152.1 monocarboxylate transporter 6 [Monodelphis domestica]